MCNASASLVNGVLTITVPKRLSPDVTVPVAAEPLPDDLPEPRTSFSLALPGFAPSHVSVAIKSDGGHALHIAGHSPSGASFMHVLALPERALVSEAVASLSDGLFNFSLPLRVDAVASLPVLDARPSQPLAGDSSCFARLFDAPLPGLCAQDVTAELRGCTLTLAAVKPAAFSKQALRHSLRLPPDVDAAQLCVVLQHGLLTVEAAKKQPVRKTISLEPAAAGEPVSLAAATRPASPTAIREPPSMATQQSE